MTRWEPDAAWLDARFDQALRPTLFGGHETEGKPVAVLLGGQPGAGKSRAAQFARELHSRPLVIINGDDFRALHPDFKRLQRDDPQRMPAVTQAVSAPLVERAIEYAKRHQVSVLVEGTFRDPAVALRTTQVFHAAGYAVHAVALAVPPEVSRASTIGRFHETLGTDQNRWTAPQAHDDAVRGMPPTVEALALSEAVARLSVLTREGQLLVDDSVPGPDRARTVLSEVHRAHTRPLTSSERALVDATTAAVQTERSSSSPAQRSALDAARAAFARPATEATRSTTTPSTRTPRRPPPGAMTERGFGLGD